MSRGNGRMRIFLDDRDYRKFQFVLGDVADEFDLEVWDFCVMPNHYHLAVCPRKANLSIAIKQLNSVYAMWWNATHQTVGHAFQGRFKDQIVQREGYLWALCRYIARNPVRAKLVDDPSQWRWSSYRATAGLCPNPGFLLNEPILRQFGEGDDASRRASYREHVLTQTTEQHEEERYRSKERIVGDCLFKRRLLRDEVPQEPTRELAPVSTVAGSEWQSLPV
jgi:putative transposase